ncbi:MAG TPA: PAS domain S-box protein [Vicinamibacterales bacterium]|nr:PAS domain S-box protein [Vicinamibacterales bacterium]
MRRALKYLFAIAAVAGAVLVRALLDPILGDSLPLVTLYGALAITVVLCGIGPAVLAALTGYVACSYLFIEPRGSVQFHTTADVVGVVAYLFTCALVIASGEAARRARARVGDQREVLRVTLGSIGDAVITTDTRGNITYLNAVAEHTTGWSQEAVGQPLDRVFRIVNEDTRKPVDNPAAKALRDGTVVGLANHTLLIRKDGTELAIDDSAAPIANDNSVVSGCVLIFRDVSERRRLERAAAERLTTANLLASIVESSEDAILSKTLGGVIQSWNAGAERLFGYSADEAIGRHISLVIPPERLAEEDRIIALLTEGQRIEHFETERVRKTGQRVTVSLTISPLRDANGTVIGASKIARDITARRQLEDHLRRMAIDLAEADRQKGEFLATLAHELRNPLAPLRSALELLKQSGADAERRQLARDTMDRQLGQMVRLVDDLLDVNRVMHNRLELRPVDIDIALVIHQAVEMSQPLIDNAGHHLRVILPAEPLFLHADPVRLTQVFANLLNNSCKYTPAGGQLQISAERDGDHAVVRVKDTGAGIPSDQLEKIFNMFNQVDRSPERAQGGLGIGLTLVRRLAEMHGGSVHAQSDGHGKGSEFIVRLPALAQAPQAEKSQAPAAAAAAKRRRVLIVDDNRDAADALAMLLRHTGHDAFVAYDGKAALAAAETDRPDVILLDIGLPGMSGHDVCRQVREQPWGRNIRMIALTGWGQEEDRRKSTEAGFDGHLVKPVDIAAVLEQFQRAPALG